MSGFFWHFSFSLDQFCLVISKCFINLKYSIRISTSVILCMFNQASMSQIVIGFSSSPICRLPDKSMKACQTSCKSQKISGRSIKVFIFLPPTANFSRSLTLLPFANHHSRQSVSFLLRPQNLSSGNWRLSPPVSEHSHTDGIAPEC